MHVLSDLLAGHAVAGPAIVMNGTSTCVVEPGATAHVTEEGDLRIELHDDDAAAAAADAATDGGSDAAARVACDPITLSVFSNRFMSIAEQMGRTLQRTATSVNIKERLDFSCALFGGDGGLVANAPHVPVHLGAMADTVRAQVAKLEGTLAPGDVIAANHPAAGGSHLPDITVITPVFAEGAAAAAGQRPLFYCASRGHHADVGGSTPGSMPADSTTLAEEGAVFDAFLLVKRGAFDEAGARALLAAPADAAPPVEKPHLRLAGCRNVTDVLSDLKAQVAANAKGIALLHELIREHGRRAVLSYMGHVQDNAAACVRSMLREYAARIRADGEATLDNNGGGGGVLTVRAADQMDDGSPIELQLTIDEARGLCRFDFGGTARRSTATGTRRAR